MSTAVLYIRVSTDEQALKGYSQRSQAERLQSFCANNNIEILQTIFEDHSAKTFLRPAWTKLMQHLTQQKLSRPNLLLFTRWDRFSRNTADAYYVITQLSRLGIDPQAIEQPLNMSIPENKVLLAMYIVTSEVENDRRSLNIKYGIHRAKQEGRWMGHAPMGFIKKATESGKTVLTPYEPQATLVRKVFTRISELNTSISRLYKQSLDEGLHCSLGAFWCMIRNPVYCGRVKIPEFTGKEKYEVRGIHEPLVNEELFDQVQRILDNRKRNTYINKPLNDLLPLRGFIYCPCCHRKLYGSGSKGHTKRYYYYHCYAPCHYRVRSDRMNTLFLGGIANLKAEDDYVSLYKEILQDTFKDIYNKKVIDQVYITRTIEKLIDRVAKARELLSNGNIDCEDFLAIQKDCEARINTLGLELHNAYSLVEIQKVSLDQAVSQISHLDDLYERADLALKRRLINLILVSNLIFNEAMFGQDVKKEVQVIYGICDPGSHLSLYEGATKHEQETPDVSPNFDNSMCAKIREIEHRKGSSIDWEGAKNVLQWLRDLARISQECRIKK
ncbi:recombinase family protein [Chitinophaga arvensicola]|uniref:Site-specific DNA recombinase n=1 Tax=Chitinophaga arvensicola TaxID=29529 RepID=A0A1I0SE86_9BACT|nr:recombinase family protein [Chitinophaga arvensicola]SEW57435.1 Site-specific DNA recombinase [Chitinophaga arvensicola]